MATKKKLAKKLTNLKWDDRWIDFDARAAGQGDGIDYRRYFKNADYLFRCGVDIQKAVGLIRDYKIRELGAEVVDLAVDVLGKHGIRTIQWFIWSNPKAPELANHKSIRDLLALAKPRRSTPYELLEELIPKLNPKQRRELLTFARKLQARRNSRLR